MIKRPLPVVMFPSLYTFMKGTLDVGWLIIDSDSMAYILRWGNTKDKNIARVLSKNLIKEKGERLILLYDKLVNPLYYMGHSAVINISNETVENILSNSEILYNYIAEWSNDDEQN